MSYGESSRDSHSWSQTPSGAMRYTAPFGERRSSVVEPRDKDEPPTSTIDIDVISADTDGTGARDGSLDGRSMSSVLTGALPDPGRPLTAAT